MNSFFSQNNSLMHVQWKNTYENTIKLKLLKHLFLIKPFCHAWYVNFQYTSSPFYRKELHCIRKYKTMVIWQDRPLMMKIHTYYRSFFTIIQSQTERKTTEQWKSISLRIISAQQFDVKMCSWHTYFKLLPLFTSHCKNTEKSRKVIL